jgi:hypothetical protein
MLAAGRTVLGRAKAARLMIAMLKPQDVAVDWPPYGQRVGFGRRVTTIQRGARRRRVLELAPQDAEASRKICASRRAAGIEVWFDQK